MLFCESGMPEGEGFDALVCFVQQLRSLGSQAFIRSVLVRNLTNISTQFDAAPYLTDCTPQTGDKLILIKSHLVTKDSLSNIRNSFGEKGISATAYGKFNSHSELIATKAQLTYALGGEVEIFEDPAIKLFPKLDAPVFLISESRSVSKRPKVAMVFPELNDKSQVSAIRTLGNSQIFDVEIITSGKQKSDWIDSQGFDVPCWHLGEILPQFLAQRFDAAIFCDEAPEWFRFSVFFANLAAANIPLIDASPGKFWSLHYPEIIVGPFDYGQIGVWFAENILKNLQSVRREVEKSERLTKDFSPSTNISKIVSTSEVPSKKVESPVEKRTIFVPTNGVGLGHARRCALIANEMRSDSAPLFAAFPSCLGMLTKAGFDAMPLIGRTPLRDNHCNDLINHLRLNSICQESEGLVFDGGYVFDSILRAASTYKLPSVWIRRGLWQERQNNSVAIDRQKVFSSILVPTEAFEELNLPVSNGQVTEVGPIVSLNAIETARSTLAREKILQAAGLQNEKIVVTMLGSGVAADRRAQVNALCAHFATRTDVAHLVVAWPTATTDPAWFMHRNTKVVRTLHSAGLIQCADLLISAAGYNTFHEAMYGAVPTIFLPQMAAFMDDQRARARAAAERELAELVEPWELLSLTRVVDEFLEGKADTVRENLRQYDLPETGTKVAASHISEVIRCK